MILHALFLLPLLGGNREIGGRLFDVVLMDQVDSGKFNVGEMDGAVNREASNVTVSPHNGDHGDIRIGVLGYVGEVEEVHMLLVYVVYDAMKLLAGTENN